MLRKMTSPEGANRRFWPAMLSLVIVAILVSAGFALGGVGRAASTRGGVGNDSKAAGDGLITATVTATATTASTAPASSATATATATLSGAGSATATPTTPVACGIGWTVINSPAQGPFTDVAIHDAREMWALSGSDAVRWTSGNWITYTLATVLPQATSITGSPEGGVYAAGGPNIARWNGFGWEQVSYPTPTLVPNPTPYRDTPYFKGIKSRNFFDAWAVGGYSGQFGSSCVSLKYCGPLIAHFNGNSWVILEGPTPSKGVHPGEPDGASLTFQHYDGIAFLGLDETWLVGSNDQWGGQIFEAYPMALHCIYLTCTSITPVHAGTKTQLVAITAAATDDVWAVGAVGLGSTSSLIEHWNGTSWSVVSHPNVGSLTDVTAAADDDIWAVGPTAVLHYDGTSWQIASTPAGAVAIDSRGKYNVWAVGNVVMHYPDMPIFLDVTPDNPFYRHIQELACRNIIGGYPDGSFRPNNFVSRGQQAKIVSNAAGFNEPASGQTFQDVAPGSTFYDFVQRLASRGYINGYPCGGAGEPCVPPGNLPYFRPNAQVTRGQISKIVSNAAGFNEPAGAQIFEDVAPGSTFYDYIQRLASRGYMNGYPCGVAQGEPCNPPGNRPYFRQNNNATRGQTSKIVANTFFPGCCSAAER